MTDTLKYHTLEELRQLSLTELRALWDLVPTERQRLYKAAYEREVQAAGASGSDRLEQQVNAELARRYAETALVPSGNRWARTPTRVQDAARDGDDLNPAEPAAVGPSPRVLAAIGLAVAVLLAIFLLSRGRGANDVALNVTATPTDTPTPAISPTPTPLALEDQDAVIEGGDSTRAVAYPVQLQVTTADGGPPRVWVVQRRVVGTSEWNYDPNPDTASFVNGLAVRPVLGIPWSPENAAWFAGLGDGASFALTMNTGAVRRYEFAARSDVRRSETGIFRQVSPGLVLLLLGETDNDGLPTATRPLIVADYPAGQELGRDGALLEALPGLPDAIPPTDTPTPSRFAGVHVELIRATYITGQLTTVLRLYNGGDAVLHLTPVDITLTLGYSPNPPGPVIPADGLTPFDLLPGQAADLTLVWLWSGEPYGTLSLDKYWYSITLTL